jgi:hypothetical protein
VQVLERVIADRPPAEFEQLTLDREADPIRSP